MAYLSYEEYQAYGGTLDATTFANFDFEAEALINYRTFNRLKAYPEIPEEVKRLTKYLIDLAQKKAEALSLGAAAGGADTTNVGAFITNETNDGVSVSYSGMASADLYKLCNKEATQAIDTYLDAVMDSLGRKVLYRGLYPGE